MNKAAELVADLQKAGVKFWEEDGLLKLSAPKGALLPDVRAEIGGLKEEILQVLRTGKLQSFTVGSTISPAERSRTHAPLSFAQKRLWYLCELEGDKAITYNMPAALLLKGNLHTQLLVDSLNRIVSRHEVLRTTFRKDNDQVVQYIAPQQLVSPITISLGHLPEGEREAQLKKLMYTEAVKPFDLAAGPLLRCTLIHLGDTRHALLITLHHIISDGWSIDILINELANCYSASVNGEAPEQLSDMPVQYADFAIWQKHWLQGPTLDNLLNYWKKRLDGIPALLALPTDNPRPAVQSFRGGLEQRSFGGDIASNLKKVCRERSVTPFMVLISVYAVLLSRWSGQDDIVIGSVIANRNRKEVEALIGFFVNSLVFRIGLENDMTFADLLLQVRDLALEAFDHQDLPFEKLVEELHPERSLSHSPLFQVAFALQNTGNNELQLPGLEVEDLNTHSGTSKYDLTLFATESAIRVSLVVEYNSDIFTGATIRRFIDQFGILLGSLLQDTRLPVFQVDILSAPEKSTLLNEYSGKSTPQVAHENIVRAFEQKVKEAPGPVAVFCGKELLTYDELNTRSNKLAHYIIASAVQPHLKIGVMAGRSVEQLIGMLAVLKAGCVYVPIDPDYPAERRQYIISDSGISSLFVHTQYAAICADCTCPVIAMDDLLLGSATTKDANPAHIIAASDPAYIIYTSGSTGRPKGVVLAHGGLINMVLQQVEIFGVKATSKILQFASPGFDASVSEFFMALAAGASLVLVAKEELAPDAGFIALLHANEITHITLPPSFLSLLPNAALPHLSSLVVAGEVCNSDLVRKWGIGRNLYNAYGPTESTVCTSISLCNTGSEQVDIGKPLDNIRVYVVDRNNNLCPIGVPGELLIGGIGLAIGYHNRPELNAEKFISLSMTGMPPQRLYRSGDRARFLIGGEIEYLGRVDDQVKIRGFRIEPGEIESVLCTSPLVKDAAVVVSEDMAGEKRLYAYVCPNANWEQKLLAGAGSSIVAEQVAHWKEIFEDSYDYKASDFADATFNISGWNSSYTGQPIPPDEMRHWVDDTVSRILAYKPVNVLEIGCGSGLLLFRIAPNCSHYIGTDFSQNAITYLRSVIGEREIDNVELRLGDALAITGSEDRRFDMVILNSVSQYFPDQEYLLEVIRNVTSILTPGGHFFLGDVRIQSLNELFKASIELSKEHENLGPQQLLQRIHLLAEQEEELLVDPQFFKSLPGILPGITGVKTLLKQGRYDNELNTFRYDVIIEKEGSCAAPLTTRVDWLAKRPNKGQISSFVARHLSTPFVLANVPNSRLVAKSKEFASLDSQSGNCATGCSKEEQFHPDDFFELQQHLPCKIEISWSERDHSLFDVYFVPFGKGNVPFYAPPPSDPAKVERSVYTNAPIKTKFRQRLVPALKEFLAARLPVYMMPSFFEIVKSLPVTPNGKTDRAALVRLTGEAQTRGVSAYIAPASSDEIKLSGIWEELLNVSPIGIHDNFFDVGGHSLLAIQLINRINSEYHSKMLLVDLFTHPDISSQALFLTAKSTPADRDGAIKLSDGTFQYPLFFIPGAGGNVLQASSLGQAFAGSISLYGLEATAVQEGAPSTNIESIARQNIRAMKKVLPHGPYYLLGHSIGGWIAYEIARQLEAEGGSVAFLGVLDGVAPRAYNEPIGLGWDDNKWLAEFAAMKGIHIDQAEFSSVNDLQRKAWLKSLLERELLIAEDSTMDKLKELVTLLKAALGSMYDPPEMSAKLPLHLFLAATLGDEAGVEDPGGWARFASSVTVQTVAGDHFSMLKHPHVQSLGQIIVETIIHSKQ